MFEREWYAFGFICYWTIDGYNEKMVSIIVCLNRADPLILGKDYEISASYKLLMSVSLSAIFINQLIEDTHLRRLFSQPNFNPN